MKTLFVAFTLLQCVASFTPFAAHSAFAAPPANGSAHADNPCAADFDKFCRDKAKGFEETLRCMQSHHDELSPGCRARQEEGKRACAADVEKFCKAEKGDGVKVIGCLRDHAAQLSDECRRTRGRGRAH